MPSPLPVLCLNCPMSQFLYTKEIALLAALHKLSVRYLVVGGHAVISHGYLRLAKDLDLWLFPSKENAGRFAEAFSQIKAPLPDGFVTPLAQPDRYEPIPGWNIEVLTSVEGLEFDAAFSQSLIMYANGVQYAVLGFADLIKNKLALGREADLEDIQQLQGLHTADPTTTTACPSAACITPPAPQ